MAYLEYQEGARLVRREVDEEAVIGRRIDCDIRIGGAVVSRQHARVSRRQGAWEIEDLESRHGTFVNRLRVEGSKKLSDGDQITIGQTLLTFHMGGPEKAAKPERRPSWSGRGITVTRDYATVTGPLPNAALGQRLSAAPDLEAALCEAVALAMESTGANRGVLALRRGKGFRRQVELVGDSRRPSNREIVISERFIDLLVRGKKPLMSQDTDQDRELSVSDSIVKVDIRSIIGVPLLIEQEVVGYLYVDTLGDKGNVRGRIFRRDDIEKVAAIAGLLVEEIARRGAG